MNEYIVRLDNWLRLNRPAYYAQLSHGASEEQLRAFEHRTGLQLPAQFAELYRWRNGQSATCYKTFHDNRMFASLERVAEAWRMMKELLEGGTFAQAHWWSKGWLPFLDNGGGDYLCLDLEGTFTGLRGQVLEFWHDDAGRTVLFPDMGAYLEALVRTLEETEWEEEEEFWEIDPEIAAEVSTGYPKRFKAGG